MNLNTCYWRIGRLSNGKISRRGRVRGKYIKTVISKRSYGVSVPPPSREQGFAMLCEARAQPGIYVCQINIGGRGIGWRPPIWRLSITDQHFS